MSADVRLLPTSTIRTATEHPQLDMTDGEWWPVG